MKRLYHTAKNRAAPLPHKGHGHRLQGVCIPDVKNKPAPPPGHYGKEQHRRTQHDFTFLPYEGEEDDDMRAVQHAERRKRERAMSYGDRAVLICAALAGVYILMRGVWWALLWMIGQ